MATFIAPTRTFLISSDWICQNVPCKVVGFENSIRFRPFNKSRTFSVTPEQFSTHFKILDVRDGCVVADGYVKPIPLTEFDVQKVSLNKLYKHFEKNPSFVGLLRKINQDSYDAKGSSKCINIKEFSGDLSKTKLERLGHPVFNRSPRHTHPIPEMSREEFEKTPGFPAPIGIRREDFALPSEQNNLLKDLLSQLFSCAGAPECPEEFSKDLNIKKNSHTCLWCGEVLDVTDVNQDYCANEHTINFCHRDPTIGTKVGNVYLGHCSCNREQGGYSEEERIEQIVRLVKTNPEYLSKLKESITF